VVAAAVAVLWIVLSMQTHLIFHLMPAAPSLASAFAFRWRTGGGRAHPRVPPKPREVLVLLVGALVITTATTLILARSGEFLDRPLLVAAIAVVGATIAGIWLRGR